MLPSSLGVKACPHMIWGVAVIKLMYAKQKLTNPKRHARQAVDLLRWWYQCDIRMDGIKPRYGYIISNAMSASTQHFRRGKMTFETVFCTLWPIVMCILDASKRKAYCPPLCRSWHRLQADGIFPILWMSITNFSFSWARLAKIHHFKKHTCRWPHQGYCWDSQSERKNQVFHMEFQCQQWIGTRLQQISMIILLFLLKLSPVKPTNMPQNHQNISKHISPNNR